MTAIDGYVDELASRLRLRPAYAERLLTEVADHLRDSADREMAAGAGAEEAERIAVGRFGSAREVADAANGGHLGAATRIVATLASVAAVGSLAVLVGTALGRVLAAATSTGWVYGYPRGASASRGDIAHWLAVQPHAATWRSAATLENADDSLVLRGGAALLGLVVCGLVAVIASRRLLPASVRWAAAGSAAVFALAAAGLLLSAALDVSVFEWGRGQAIGDGVAALAAGLGCLVAARRHAAAPERASGRR